METGAQTLHHRHAEPLFATHYFADAAWRAEQRDEVSSREAVLIHKVADQIGDTRRPTGPFHFLVRGNQARLRL
jgi:predicted nucleic acid-binding protein